MIREARTQPSLVAAAAVCAVASIVFAWTLVRALTFAPILPTTGPSRADAVQGDMDTAPPAIALQAAVDADPFRVDRHRPAQRFLLPGTRVARTARVASPTLVLAGTAVYPGGGGVALVRVAGRTGTVMVRVGATVEGLTLRSVAPDQAVFARSNGATIMLRVPKAGG